jgi:hypothetical protein
MKRVMRHVPSIMKIREKEKENTPNHLVGKPTFTFSGHRHTPSVASFLKNNTKDKKKFESSEKTRTSEMEGYLPNFHNKSELMTKESTNLQQLQYI